jgi:hypothetical protein
VVMNTTSREDEEANYFAMHACSEIQLQASLDRSSVSSKARA